MQLINKGPRSLDTGKRTNRCLGEENIEKKYIKKLTELLPKCVKTTAIAPAIVLVAETSLSLFCPGEGGVDFFTKALMATGYFV